MTGAAGFIGYNVSLSILKNYELIALDNLSRGRKDRLINLKKRGATAYIADIRDIRKISKIIKEEKPESVVHCAALISVKESFKYPLLYESVNSEGTLALLDACAKYKIDKFIYISSAAVYGNPMYLPIDERHPRNPASPYGVSKLIGEEYLKMYQRTFGMKGIILRLFNVYGYGQNIEYAGVITKFVERIRKGLPPIIYGDGSQTRDFVHVRDVSEAIVKALNADIDGIFNIGSGQPTTILKLAKEIIALLGMNIKPEFTNPRKGDIHDSYADITNAKRKLNWRPNILLRTGLKELLRQ